ncbi:hypothetical protein BJP25_01805 [Actinokineospora bangkokensis]|uniref:Copper chaperone PCu(A)C n=1 Tax=Actinokineospora bangkokensis TaxID=1193682 RepID=A0A1Q9LE33_9PSEU|nr:hypothetical protein BJP25_01805 [Actinokineospora bangkokensis]
MAPAVVGLGLALALAGCGAGQITQTDSMLPAVNGVEAGQGAVVLRDAAIAYPEGGSYKSGADAPLVLTIVNTGANADKLTSVTTPVAASATITGNTDLPGGFALAVGTPGVDVPGGAGTSTSASASATSAPGSSSAAPSSGASSAPSTTSGAPSSAALPLGQIRVVLTGVNTKLVPGETYPVTFVFANAGQVTAQLPIAAPSSPRTESEHGEHEG